MEFRLYWQHWYDGTHGNETELLLLDNAVAALKRRECITARRYWIEPEVPTSKTLTWNELKRSINKGRLWNA